MKKNPYKLLVNEIYPCIQGEGYNAGRPSILVRLQLCNLRCSWCDSKYTHTLGSDPQKRKPQMLKTIADIINIINKYSKLSNVIITGGEPTLQDFSPLVLALGRSYNIEVETNGTIVPHRRHPNFSESSYRRLQWNISPKLINSQQKIVLKSLEYWSQLSQTYEKVFFKFVIREKFAREDLKEIVSLCSYLHIATHKVQLMAEGVSIASQVQNDWLMEMCLKFGFDVSPRLHVLHYGAKRSC